MDQCSIMAYEDLKKRSKLSRSMAQYLTIFFESKKPLTHLEATELVCKTFNVPKSPTRNGRISELESKGLVSKIDRVVCPVTNMTVNRWIWTGRVIPLTCIEQDGPCRHCHGTGRATIKKFVESEAAHV